MGIERSRMSRRNVLRFGAATAAAGLVAPLPSTSAGAAVASPALIGPCGGPAVLPQTEINGQVLYYEGTLQPHTFYFEENFYNRLEAWFVHWKANVLSTWVPNGIYSDGAYDPDPCGSEHAYGRAFDLTRIYINGDGRGFNGRYDQWSTHSGENRARAERRYWAGVASLQTFFAPVLAWPYQNPANHPTRPLAYDHYTHVHVDTTQLAANGFSAFNPNSIPQRQYLASALVSIWGYVDLGITTSSSWSVLKPYAHDALWRMGINGQITTQQHWWSFNTGTIRLGTGEAWY